MPDPALPVPAVFRAGIPSKTSSPGSTISPIFLFCAGIVVIGIILVLYPQGIPRQSRGTDNPVPVREP